MLVLTDLSNKVLICKVLEYYTLKPDLNAL